MRVPILEDDPRVTERRKQIVISPCSPTQASGRSRGAAIDATGNFVQGLQIVTDDAPGRPLRDLLGAGAQELACSRNLAEQARAGAR